MRTLRVSAAGAATCLALAGLGAALPTGSASAASRSTLPGSRPSWARSSALRGSAPADAVVHLRVYLPWRDAAGLARTAHDVSTPGTARYGKYLTPQQFRAAYAPKQTDVAAVQNWLKGQGFSIANVPDSGHFVAVEGTVAQAQAAFGTTLGEYTAYGRVLRAPESAPSVPASLGGVVSAVVGLDDSPLLQAPDNSQGNGPDQNHGAPGIGFRAGRPCSTYFGEKTVTTTGFTAYGSATKPIATCGYTPAQVRGLYGLTDPNGGAGQTVAFVGATASPTLKQDVTQYSRLHSLPDPRITEIVAPGVYRHPDTPQQVPGDFYGEETLDAEAIHTTAPGAALLYVGSSNAYQDFDASIAHIVDKHLAPIISISYGFAGEAVPQGFINSLDATFQQAVATGIGIFVSSGDSGDDATVFGTTTVDFYADSPNVTAVGGTSGAIVPAAPTGTGTTASGAPAARDPRAAADTYGVDDPAGPLNQPGWTRSFEVGWQTGRDDVQGSPVLSGGPTAYTLSGTLKQPLPGFFFGGGGGGVSKVFPQPSYQKGVTDAAADGSTGYTGGRAVPDISALGDPNTGFLVGQTQTFSDGTYYDEYRIGGTSLSAPLTAGMAAVANQRNGGVALGFLNPRIYGAYRASASTAYYDVDQADLFGTTTSSPLPAVLRVNFKDNESAANGLAFTLRTLEDPDTTLHSVRGYDTATGVGSPTGDGFFAALLAQ